MYILFPSDSSLASPFSPLWSATSWDPGFKWRDATNSFSPFSRQSMAIQIQKTPPPSLMAIPAEIRLMIYPSLLTSPTGYVSITQSSPPLQDQSISSPTRCRISTIDPFSSTQELISNLTLPITFLNRKTYHETSNQFYKTNKFFFDPYSFVTLTTTNDPSCFESTTVPLPLVEVQYKLQNLTLSYPFLSPELWNAMALDKIESLALLGGLKKVEIIIERDEDAWMSGERTLVVTMWRALGCLREFRGELERMGVEVRFMLGREGADVEGKLEGVLMGVKGDEKVVGMEALRGLCGLDIDDEDGDDI